MNGTPPGPSLDARLGDLCVGVTRLGLPCRAAMPTRHGDLLLVLDDARGRSRLIVTTRARPTVRQPSARFGSLHLYLSHEGPEPAARLAVALAVLERLRATPDGSWLDLHSRERHEVEPTAAGLARLLAWQALPGAPFWRGWRLEAVEAVAGTRFRPVLRFAPADDGRPPAVFVLAPDGSTAPDELPIKATVLGVVARTGSRPDDAGADELDAAVALLLALSLHDGMRWGPAPGPASTDPAHDGRDAHDDRFGPEPPPEVETPRFPEPRPSEETLLDHCFRTGHLWFVKPSLFFDTWGDSDFFVLTSLFGEAFPTVFHGNRECQTVKESLAPRISHGASPYSNHVGARAWMVHEMRCTDTDDAAAVFGGTDRLEAVIRGAADDHPGREVRVLSGCDCHVVGDDVHGVCTTLQDSGCAVQCLRSPLPRFTEALGRNWWEVFLRARDRGVQARPDAVNLVGFDWPGQPVVRELEHLLGRMGVRVAATFFPGCVPGFANRAAEASVTVASPWVPVRTVVVPGLVAEGFRVISPEAPYGEQGTRAWLDAIADALGRPRPSDAEWQSWRRELAPDLDRLRAEASGVAAGIIADRGTVRELEDPSFFFGFRPAHALADLGLQVVLAGRDAAVADADDPAPAGAGRPRRVEHDPEADPMPLIAVQRLDLVYCDLDQATHVKREGASPFSISDLEPGLAGAARSVARLVARSRMRLYASHGRFLGGGDGR